MRKYSKLIEHFHYLIDARFPDEKFWKKDGSSIGAEPVGVPKGTTGMTHDELGAHDADDEIEDDYQLGGPQITIQLDWGGLDDPKHRKDAEYFAKIGFVDFKIVGQTPAGHSDVKISGQRDRVKQFIERFGFDEDSAPEAFAVSSRR